MSCTVTSGIWHWAGPAKKLSQHLLSLVERGGAEAAEVHRLFLEAVGALLNFKPNEGAVVEIRYPGTQRQHIVVAHCNVPSGETLSNLVEAPCPATISRAIGRPEPVMTNAIAGEQRSYETGPQRGVSPCQEPR